ncbi:zinc-dependent alcohol dehydrogenase family protein [Gillisia limnaea]|uniref:Alcohol dehydrogenase GroES domain protein n=1 Tax=Gillisia limnaea (strain DSM 15749 / LMG 21470 / R-8282) TaxID=865937 RepID=H2BUI2_GILLR|nr:zinc-dependent alcohol dehydrogenase family protein [Gillisia limnaea]EHQ03860.1 Alcohol dehydrogenase GroES domain protein [Gillisia limnaea DSM 15749]
MKTKTKKTEKPSGASTMKGLVYDGPGKISLKDIQKPKIEKSTDVVVKITKTTICGTDLGILHGKTPSVKPGTTLGHEGVGIIEATGDSVRNFKKGDRVIISCITSDGSCEYCKKQMYSHCEDGGWILGHLINGTQAEYVRIPHADNSLYLIPEGSDEEALVMLSDILPTGHEIGVQYGRVKPGDTIAIIGAGPIGMSALLTAQFYSPAKIYMIDIDENRLKMSEKFGATDTINTSKEDAVKKILSETKDGVDVAIEAVGVPETFDICQKIVRPGGHVANVGVHGKPVEFQIQDLWIKNITLTTGLVNTNTTPMLLKTVESGKLKPAQLITHHFKLDNILEAYEVFGNAGKEKAIKVIIEP